MGPDCGILGSSTHATAVAWQVAKPPDKEWRKPRTSRGTGFENKTNSRKE